MEPRRGRARKDRVRVSAVAQHVLVVRSPTDRAATNQAKRCGLASYAHIVDRQSEGSMSVSPRTLARPMM